MTPVPLADRPRLLIATTHPWRAAIQVGAHAYAREFVAAGWRVGMVSMPLTPLHVAKLHAPDVRRRWAAWASPAGSDLVDDFTPLTLVPLIGRGFASRRLMRSWLMTTFPRLTSQLRKHGWFSPDLLLFDSPIFSELAATVTPARTIYRVADYLPGFVDAPPLWVSMEREAAAAADLVLYTTPELSAHITDLGARSTMLIENGVDVHYYAEPREEPADLRGIPHPRAVYVGELRGWFDYEAVHGLCQMRPDLHVVVVGPKRHAKFRELPNLYPIGMRSRERVPGYLQHCDVGIIPFDVVTHRHLVSSINPLKLYEYMAASLPVVSADWPAVRRLNSPALLYDDLAGFASAVSDAIDNRDRLAAAGRSWVASADWAARLAPLQDKVREWHLA